MTGLDLWRLLQRHSWGAPVLVEYDRLQIEVGVGPYQALCLALEQAPPLAFVKRKGASQRTIVHRIDGLVPEDSSMEARLKVVAHCMGHYWFPEGLFLADDQLTMMGQVGSRAGFCERCFPPADIKERRRWSAQAALVTKRRRAQNRAAATAAADAYELARTQGAPAETLERAERLWRRALTLAAMDR